ncbi:MAG: hypothetical protein RIE56_00995 [Amphiplicatus sp.]
MKILTSILLFLIGCGAIVYAYVGGLFALAGEVEQTARSGDDVSAFNMVVDFIMSGKLPEPTPLLYFGLLLIVFSIVNLFVRGQSNDRRDPV